MPPLSETDIYNVVGEDGFHRLVAAFYRQVPADPVLGPMYPPADLAGAEARLRGFLIQRFGGPQTYSQERGHPRLRMRHAPFAVDVTARQHWMAMMTRALDEVAFPADVRQLLETYFASTATSMINRPI
jgi:hemoglobin